MNTILDLNMNLESILSTVFTELKKATKVKRHQFRYVVLSTTENQNVSSRWVVFRKFTDQETFLVFTDARSTKVDELKKNAQANLLFFNNKNGLQVRIDGKILLHHKNELTKKYWPGVKSTAEKSYTSKQPPGSKVDNIDEAHNWSPEYEDDHFMVLELIPAAIDVLQLNGEKHIRASYTVEPGGWEGNFLVP